jgi:hypothetical protein
VQAAVSATLHLYTGQWSAISVGLPNTVNKVLRDFSRSLQANRGRIPSNG